MPRYVTFQGVQLWWDSDGTARFLVKIGKAIEDKLRCPLQSQFWSWERAEETGTRTQHTTKFMVGYKAIKISR